MKTSPFQWYRRSGRRTTTWCGSGRRSRESTIGRSCSAQDEERLLITFDKDFGALTFQNEGPQPADILLFRLPPLAKNALVQFMVETIAERSDWAGHFAVIEQDRIRMRPLPDVSS